MPNFEARPKRPWNLELISHRLGAPRGLWEKISCRVTLSWPIRGRLWKTARKRSSQGMKVTPACDLVFVVTEKVGRGRSFWLWLIRTSQKWVSSLFWDWKTWLRRRFMAECVLVRGQGREHGLCKLVSSLERWVFSEEISFLEFPRLSECWQGKDAIKLFVRLSDTSIPSGGYGITNCSEEELKLSERCRIWPNFRTIRRLLKIGTIQN